MNDGRATLPSPRWRVRRVVETGSTNTDLAEAARRGEPDGAVLVADTQTAGRGRLGRTWSAPPGASLLLSVLLRPPAGAALHGATQALAVAAADACRDVAGVEPELKWPNDLVVGDRKLAGILAEAVSEEGRVVAVVAGIGLNVEWPPAEELPGELADRVVALNHLTGRSIDRDALLDALLGHLAERVDQWEQHPADLTADYRYALTTLGREVQVQLPGEVLRGRAVDLAPDGALVVDSGLERVVVAVGDVIHVRRA